MLKTIKYHLIQLNSEAENSSSLIVVHPWIESHGSDKHAKKKRGSSVHVRQVIFFNSLSSHFCNTNLWSQLLNLRIVSGRNCRFTGFFFFPKFPEISILTILLVSLIANPIMDYRNFPNPCWLSSTTTPPGINQDPGSSSISSANNFAPRPSRNSRPNCRCADP